jgi:hypothetical protein
MIVLVIDEPTPSLNRMLGHHWSKKREMREKWGWLTKRAIRRANLWIPPKWARARVRIERYGARILDADNFRAGTKFLMDSLVAEGIITDDKPEVVGEPELKQFAGKERKTIVYVEAA